MSEPAGVDTETASIARVYDAALGGKDNFEVDRVALDRLLDRFPEYVDNITQNRSWQRRVLRWLTASAGVDQFLDIGSGLPTRQNTHEVVRSVRPDARVVYADNDPAVAAYGRALLEDDENTRFLAADLTAPESILGDPVVLEHLDLARPVAMMHGATLHFVRDDDLAVRVMTTYLDALAPGSYVALSHGYRPGPDEPMSERVREFLERYASVSSNLRVRDRAEILALLPGTELVPPGLVPVHRWWPEGPRLKPVSAAAEVMVGVVARKP